MEKYSNYMGGTNISLQGLKKCFPMVNVDGSRIGIEEWFKEIEIFETLIPNTSKVYIPYGGVEKHGTFLRIEWEKFEITQYIETTEENEDWWFYRPVLIVEYGVLSKTEYIIYEYSFYEENSELVHINHIIPQTVEVFTPKGRSLGFVNEFEFNDLRIQISKNRVEGYYLMYNDKKHIITVDGKLDEWSSGLFDIIEIQLSKLFQNYKYQ